MSRENVIKAVKNLSVRRGGNIINKKELLEQDKNAICVFIGLGGLGCRAVNEIKSAATERMTDADKRFYIAIDTDKDALRKLSRVQLVDNKEEKSSVGALDEGEMIRLYDPAKPFALSAADENMQKWLKAYLFKNVVVNGDGAQATRQIGRVMLFADENYSRVETEIKTILDCAHKKRRDCNANKVRVYIIAGIAGGTGSGTVVDISFMIRNILRDKGGNLSNQVLGCIFTPDVQENDEDIRGKEEKILSIRRNFYAALKEIDYFYNNSERAKKYISPQAGVGAIEANIFDECRLIGRKASNGTEVCTDSNGVLRKFAQAVMFEISHIEDPKENNSFSYNSYLSNVPDNVGTWRTTEKAAGMNLPDWAMYRYSAFGYGSVYVPKNELFAYCAHRLLERLCELWKQQNISEEELRKKIRSVHLTDSRTFAAHLFEIAKCAEELKIDDRLLPKDPMGPGPVFGVNRYIEELDSRIIAATDKSAINRFKRAAEGIEYKTLKAEFTDKIIELVEDAFADPQKGPAYAINLLSSDISTPIWVKYYGEGVLKKLNRIKANLNTDVNNWKAELKKLREQYLEDAQKLKGFEFGQHDEGRLQGFIIGYADYAKQMVECTLLQNSSEYLEKILAILTAKNHQLFEIYSTTVKHICDEMENDAEYVTNTNRKKEGNLTTFSFDIANFDKKDPVSERIMKFFDGVIDQKAVSAEAQLFVTKVFGELKKQVEKVDNLTPEMVEDILRDYFSSTFGEWVKNTIEKFCFIAYCSEDKITPEMVTTIFEDDDKKVAAFKKVADDIRIKLTEKSKVLLPSADVTRNIENFAKYEAMGVINETANINAMMTGKIVTLQKGWSEFVMYNGVSGIPVFMVDGLRECKKLYDDSKVPGLHLDEVGEDWRLLPEVYSYPVAKLLGEYSNGPEEVTIKDKEIFKTLLHNALRANSMGLLSVVDQGEKSFFTLIHSLASEITDDDQTIYNKLKEAYDETESKDDFVAILKKAGYAIADKLDITWGAIDPHYDIMESRTELGDETNFGNFIKLVYSNVEWRTALKNALTTFEKLYGIFEKVKQDSALGDAYETRLTTLYRAIKFGLVRFDEDKTVLEVKYGPDHTLSEKQALNWEDLDKATFLYHFFVDVILDMNEEIYSMFVEYVNYTMESATTLPEIADFVSHIKDALTNKEYLGASQKSVKFNNFKTPLSVTTLSYNIPNPCGGMSTDDEIASVIKNLEGFYGKMKSLLGIKE